MKSFVRGNNASTEYRSNNLGELARTKVVGKGEKNRGLGGGKSKREKESERNIAWKN